MTHRLPVFQAQFNNALFSTEAERMVTTLKKFFGTEYVLVILLLIFVAFFWILLMIYSWNYSREHPTPPCKLLRSEIGGQGRERSREAWVRPRPGLIWLTFYLRGK